MPSPRRCSRPRARPMQWAQASELAAAVADGRASAAAVVGAALARIAKLDRVLNAFTAVLEARAFAKAEAIDAARASGRRLGPLGGVPFAVKNLFDIAGLPALAGGLVPLALGSDTNGSIRVPSSLCGIFGLKPTYGRLSRAGTFPFVASLDHVGPLARSTRDLALAYDAMQGPDPSDPVCTDRPPQPVAPLIDRGVEGVRIAVAGGYFRAGLSPEARAALARVAAALGVADEIEVPEAKRARAAAYVITASEGGALHLGRLRERARDFDPAVRDRLIAGAMIPAALVAKAQKFL